MTTTDESPDVGSNMLTELGLAITKAGGELRGSAVITPEMHVPDTPHLRISILAAWVDQLAGLLAVETMMPQVPVTFDLDVQLYRPAPRAGRVLGVGKPVKVGRSVFVAAVDLACDDGEPLGFGTGSFMSTRDPEARLPSNLGIESPLPRGRLACPVRNEQGANAKRWAWHPCPGRRTD